MCNKLKSTWSKMDMYMYGVCSTLKSLESKEDDILIALKDIKSFLGSDTTDGIRQTLLQEGIVKCIVGFLRCSNNIDILISATECLILAVLGCQEVRYKVSEMNLVLIILDVFASVRNEKVACIKHQALQEQLVSLLRKVTCNCEPNHSLFVSEGGIAVMIKLIKEQYSLSNDSYSPNTMNRLAELTIDKCFIAAVTKMPSEFTQSLSKTFPVLAALGETFIQLYPFFFVDLSGSDNRYITDVLTSEGLALPDETSFITSKDDVSWVILRVSHVSGPVQLWSEFSVDKKDKEHWEMFERFHKDAPPTSSTAPPTTLFPGSVYSVYHPAVTASVPVGWYRGWLLSSPSSSNSSSDVCEFFCMDYGFTVSVKRNNVRQLPPQFKGIRPRAAPCILTGIRPPLKSVKLLEDCTGLLRNLSFDSDSYLREMLTQGLVPLLLDLISSKPVTQMALRHSMICLMNLCQIDQVCSLMCKLGAIQILTNLFLSLGHTFEAIVQKCLLGCLQNILVRDKQSVEIFQNIKGPMKLKTWVQEEDSSSTDIEACVAMLLTAMEENGRSDRSQPSIFTSWMVTTNRRDPSTQAITNQTLVQSPAHVTARSTTITPTLSNTTQPNSVTPNTTLSSHAVNTRTSPVYRIKSQDNDKFYVTQKKHLEGLSTTSVPISYGSFVPIPHNEAIEYINIDVVTNISMGHMLRSLCGIANTETGGYIFIGVSENGRAKGIGINRNERNNVRLDVDELVTRLIPPIISSRYNITFIPITGSPRKKEQFIVSIKISPSAGGKSIHYLQMKNKDVLDKERCYIHSNGKSIKISLHDVREMVAEKELKAFNSPL